MSATLAAIQHLVASGDVRISEHGYDELANDDIFARDVLDGVSAAALVEDYPQFPKGPAVLVLHSTPKVSRSTLFGAFRLGARALRFSLRGIDPIQRAGVLTSCGGSSDETPTY